MTSIVQPNQPRWGIAAKVKGSNRMKSLLVVFGLHPSAEEALAVAMRRVNGDPSFRKRWAGCQFLPIRSDLFVEINAQATAAFIHRDDRETAL